MEKLITKFKQIRILQIFTILLRYSLGGSFVFASIFKIKGIRFTAESGKNQPIDSLAHFFETMYQSSVYWNFIGWGQLIVGFLLMSQIFSPLGAVAFFPIILNIFVITISFKSQNILIITLLMVIGNIYLLLWDWNRLKYLTLLDPQNYTDNTPAFSKRKIWIYLGVLFFLIIVIARTSATI